MKKVNELISTKSTITVDSGLGRTDSHCSLPENFGLIRIYSDLLPGTELG